MRPAARAAVACGQGAGAAERDDQAEPELATKRTITTM
jgi:hypothetical protein